MTTQQSITIQRIEAQHEAERFAADQAARDVAELDPRSVYYVIKAKLAARLVEEARAIAAKWKAGQL